MPIEKKCLWCNSNYKCKPYESATSKFCSWKCKKAYQQRNDKTVPCFYCGKPLILNWTRKNRKTFFCSAECYKKSRSKIDVICTGCGKPFKAHPSRRSYYQRLYCSSACYLKNGCIGLHGFTHNKKYDYIRLRVSNTAQYLRWKSAVLERDGYACTICGSTENLRVHHILEFYKIIYKYNPKLSPELIDTILQSPELNDLSNGKTLCNSCHIKEHHL
jgi:endogenous inhibitor of DNA gyrase (YacG/DUF329 family)